MVYEFEARSEKEAIELASQELGLEQDLFDVEILESQKSSIFKKGYVKIRVHTNEPVTLKKTQESVKTAEKEPVEEGEFEENMLNFVQTLISKMGYEATITVQFREAKKLGIKIESDHSSIIIGKKGKNLDALQLLANIYAGRQGMNDTRIILDTENYRIRREESLVRLAYTVADRVRQSRSSQLLEPMNPFERRLVHTTLNDISDIETMSEGDGLYKQIRVSYRGLKQF